MSDARVIHPAQTPEPPYFRGVSFLAGGVGDLLYGSYGRSTNTMVLDATSLAKRNGYVRAFDEVFCGAAAAVHHRGSGYNYTIAADGQGVKILTALTAKKGGGDRFEHHAYPVDNFTRADSGTVGDASSGGDHYWQEGNKGHPSGSGTTYSAFAVASNQLQMPNSSGGSLDLLIPVPSPMFVWRMELDLASFNPTGSANANFGSYFGLFHGIPMDHIKTDGTVAQYKWSAHDVLAKHESRYRPPSYVTGHATAAPWMGVHWDLRIYKEGSDYKLEITQWHYFSSLETNDQPDVARDGLRVLAGRKIHTFDDLSDFQARHYIEVGQVQAGQGKVMRTFNFWSNKDKDSAPHAAPTVKGARITTTVDSQYQSSGKYFVLSDPRGRYGHAGVFGRVEASTTGTVQMDSMTVAGGFLA